MSGLGPFGSGDDPFSGLPMFRDLAKMLSGSGPVNWEIARQVSTWIATDGQPESNVDPIARMHVEELARVAVLHVANVTGLETSATGGIVTLRPVGRAEWTQRTLDAYRPLLEQLATSLSAATGDDDSADAPDPSTDLLGGLTKVMSPVLLGMQSGFMVGHLSQRAMGQYDLPIPRPPSDELLVVPATITAFAEDWSLPPDDVLLWVCLSEVAHHAVLSRSHVRARMEELLGEYVGGFQPDTGALDERLEGLDPMNPESLQSVLGDPETLLGAMQSPAQHDVRRQLDALTAAIEGYVDHALDTVGERLIGSYRSLTEALRRRRVERNDGDKFVERLFGLELGQAQYDRGSAFVDGVVERAGEVGLARLWASARELPTPAEIDAPGLWLERIDIPD
ncbi:MAG TPA: zinc-dependent metalloprotease [Acidimicrobiales bacterium]|nr:zinc-dependent metalloprotease [Acidimicrobiales bacterium]